MPSLNLQPLITVGPVSGLDTRAAAEFVAPTDGVAISNVDPWRVAGGLTTTRGRINIVTFSHFANYQVGGLIPYAVSATDQQYVINLTRAGFSPAVVVYDPANPSQPTSGLTNGNGFDHGVQFYNIVYTNTGQQYSTLNPNNMYAWHYPAPTQGLYNYAIGTAAGSLPSATYYYAFTQVVKGPNAAFTQETTPLGAVPLTGPPPPATLYPYAFTSDGLHNAQLSGTFAGTNTDGSTYTTNVYRQSSLVPVWTLLTNLTTNTTYSDSTPDSSIAANQQLLLNQDPPPVSATNAGAIFVHQERIFAFAQVQTTNAYNIPITQTQLWYSDLGVPWRFNQVAQESGGSTLLVGNSANPGTTSYQGYGDLPVVGLSNGTSAVLFKSRTAWILFGNDPSSYFISFLFNIGCISRRSAVNFKGTIFWLSEFGFHAFAGGPPQYISRKISESLRLIPMSDQQNCTVSVAGEIISWSFPTTGVTYDFNTVTGDFSERSYAAQTAASIPSNPNQFQTGGFSTAAVPPNEVIAGRPGINTLDWWNVSEQDLGAPITASWTSPLTSSGAPHIEKLYRYITVLAPFQSGTVTVTLTIDPGTVPAKQYTATQTLTGTQTQPQPRIIFGVHPDLRGFQAQLQVQFTNTTTQTTPTTIYRCDVWGLMERALAIPE